MKLFKKLFTKKKEVLEIKQSVNTSLFNQYDEIAKLVKKARVQKNISIEELSERSKIPGYIIDSIENNIENNRPKYPFLRSILVKLENCLSLRKNILVGLLVKEEQISKNDKREFLLRKLDFINNWQGTVIYFFIMILTIFILKRYFFTNINIIEIQNFQEKIKEN